MKTIILLLAINLGFNGIGQEKTIEEDTTKFKIGNMEVILVNHEKDSIQKEMSSDTSLISSENQNEMKIELKYDGDNDKLTYWSGIEFGPTVLLNSTGGRSFESNFLDIDPLESFSVSLNLFEQRIAFGTDHIGLVTGIGFSFNEYGLKNLENLQFNVDSTWSLIDSSRIYSKNQLKASYFNVPVLLNINMSRNKDKNFHLTTGIIGGIKISSRSFQKFEKDGKKEKIKRTGDYNLNPFQALATARVGYKNFGLYANYSLTSLFEEGATEEAFPLSMGISIHF